MRMDRFKRFSKFIRQRINGIIGDKNLFMRFFALVLAVLIWFLAGGEGRFGPTERVVTVPVQVQNLPADLALFNAPDPVRVRVRGIGPLLEIAEGEIRGSVDMATAVEGEGTYGVEVSAPTGVEIVSITPRWIPLATEKILRRDFPVSVALLGLPPEEAILSLVPEPEQVSVEAPRSILDRVSQAVAYITLGGSIARVEGSFPVRAIDERGRAIEEVVIRPEQVRVAVEQVPQRTDVSLPVVPQFDGELPVDWRLGAVRVQPNQLQAVVNFGRGMVFQLNTEPISLNALQIGENLRTVSVLIPENVQLTEESQVDVLVEVIVADEPIAPEEEVPTQEESPANDVPEDEIIQPEEPPEDDEVADGEGGDEMTGEGESNG